MAQKKTKGEQLAAELAALWNDEYLASRTGEELASIFDIDPRRAEKILEAERRKRFEQ